MFDRQRMTPWMSRREVLKSASAGFGMVALAGMIDKFRYLKPALAVVLVVVGVKMMTHTWLKSVLGEHFNLYLLGLVLMILAAGVIASILANRRDAARVEPVTVAE